jgi:HK97 family phage prohead protease
METRNSPIEFELRNNANGPAPGTVVGYAAVWDSLSHDLGGFKERLRPFSMDGCMGGDIHALYNHDSSMVLGRSRAGTLRVAPDTKGLHFECDIISNSYGVDLWASLARNDVTGASFAFTVAPNGEQWSQDEAGNPVRTITEVQHLYEVSICAMPAYPATSVAMASLRNYQQEGDTLRRHVEAESRERVMRLCGA